MPLFCFSFASILLLLFPSISPFRCKRGLVLTLVWRTIFGREIFFWIFPASTCRPCCCVDSAKADFFKFPVEDGLIPPLALLFLCTATRLALNDATENVVERTLYDKVYFQHELENAMKRQLHKNNISLADIRRMYAKVRRNFDVWMIWLLPTKWIFGEWSSVQQLLCHPNKATRYNNIWCVLHKKETTGREQSSFCLVVHTSLLSLSSVEYLHMTLYTTRDSHWLTLVLLLPGCTIF